MHPSPDVLALLALGEETGTAEERAHLQTCAECQAEVADLARVVTAGRGGRAGDTGLLAPPDRVWHAIRSTRCGTSSSRAISSAMIRRAATSTGSGGGALVASSVAIRRCLLRAWCASTTLLRVMPSSQAGRLARSGRKLCRPVQAATNTFWVTSSASLASPSDRMATVKISAEYLR